MLKNAFKDIIKSKREGEDMDALADEISMDRPSSADEEEDEESEDDSLL